MDLASIRIVARAKQLALSPKQSNNMLPNLLPNQPRSRHPTILIIPTKLTKHSRKDTKLVLQLDWHIIKLEAIVEVKVVVVVVVVAVVVEVEVVVVVVVVVVRLAVVKHVVKSACKSELSSDGIKSAASVSSALTLVARTYFATSAALPTAMRSRMNIR